QDLLNQDRDHILATYFAYGYLTAIFQAKVAPIKSDPHHVEVIYTIQEGPQVFASAIIPVGAEHTHENTIKTNADLKAGKPLGRTALLQSESQLLALGIFDWAS